MADEMNDILVEKYSASEDYRYEVTKNSMNQYDVWVFGYNQRMDGYYMLDEHRQLADSLEEATAKGDSVLATLEP